METINDQTSHSKKCIHIFGDKKPCQQKNSFKSHFIHAHAMTYTEWTLSSERTLFFLWQNKQNHDMEFLGRFLIYHIHIRNCLIILSRDRWREIWKKEIKSESKREVENVCEWERRSVFKTRFREPSVFLVYTVCSVAELRMTFDLFNLQVHVCSAYWH